MSSRDARRTKQPCFIIGREIGEEDIFEDGEELLCFVETEKPHPRQTAPSSSARRNYPSSSARYNPPSWSYRQQDTRQTEVVQHRPRQDYEVEQPTLSERFESLHRSSRQTFQRDSRSRREAAIFSARRQSTDSPGDSPTSSYLLEVPTPERTYAALPQHSRTFQHQPTLPLPPPHVRGSSRRSGTSAHSSGSYNPTLALDRPLSSPANVRSRRSTQTSHRGEALLPTPPLIQPPTNKILIDSPLLPMPFQSSSYTTSTGASQVIMQTVPVTVPVQLNVPIPVALPMMTSNHTPAVVAYRNQQQLQQQPVVQLVPQRLNSALPSTSWRSNQKRGKKGGLLPLPSEAPQRRMVNPRDDHKETGNAPRHMTGRALDDELVDYFSKDPDRVRRQLDEDLDVLQIPHSPTDSQFS
ncbi:hypothetical protein Pelo_5344 [Pelomyxa schiedti]|nr:hypothetical protein Pelo_5344 [Pelomyxa schiedti]